MRKFTADLVSDGKRVARGEHWLMTRTYLRRRDRVHHKQWTILVLAGRNPKDEINCIRQLMPKAKIVAVDRDPVAVEQAARAGADVALDCDIADFRKLRGHGDRVIGALPKAIAEHAHFDAINLDFCSDVETAMPSIRKYSQAACRGHGVLMVTFSYGRDVAELYDPGPWGAVPAPLGGRVRAAAGTSSLGMSLESVLAYRGHQMPMCSCLWIYGDGRREPRHFTKVEDEDLAIATTLFEEVDPEVLYASPAARIAHFRRKLAAHKAVATRRERAPLIEALRLLRKHEIKISDPLLRDAMKRYDPMLQ